ncbi:Zinc finger, ZZ-type [Dillenia turbinata]|uniref:Zinc finger, ZZ-type n=1 Tax=Dillenia turbinata TaxID=194707 RepID=A0AAN8ZKN3_9MAGN
MLKGCGSALENNQENEEDDIGMLEDRNKCTILSDFTMKIGLALSALLGGALESSGKRGSCLLPSFRENPSWWTEHGSKIHINVGCDSCGMYPIIGERFRCKDCVEKIGYDLCGDCYKTSSKLPGRFNQQHTPDHKFELVKSYVVQKMLRVINRQLEGGFEPRIFDEVNPEDGSITITSLNDAQDQEDAEDGSIGITSSNDAQDQEDAEDEKSSEIGERSRCLCSKEEHYSVASKANQKITLS